MCVISRSWPTYSDYIVSHTSFYPLRHFPIVSRAGLVTYVADEEHFVHLDIFEITSVGTPEQTRTMGQ